MPAILGIQVDYYYRIVQIYLGFWLWDEFRKLYRLWQASTQNNPNTQDTNLLPLNRT